jgi:hypothetical protein
VFVLDFGRKVASGFNDALKVVVPPKTLFGGSIGAKGNIEKLRNKLD